jgi:cytochrome P450
MSNEKPYDSLIDVRDNAIHHQLRKPWNTAFSSEPVKDYQELLEARGNQLRDHLHSFSTKRGKGDGTPVDLAKWFSLFS